MAMGRPCMCGFDGPAFAKRLLRARKEMNLRQADLAESTGISRPYIGRMENAEHAPSFAHVIALARVLDVSLTYLAGFTNEFGSFEGPFPD